MKEKMMREGDDDVENVGIMQGFMDHMDDDDEEDDSEEEGGEEGDSEDDGEEYSAEKITRDRRPDAPEILMNNLRGDMRSIDARRDELADLVGYASACETPDSVLAMLQPILAARAPGAQGGIGALPESMAMAQGPQPPISAPEPQGTPPMPAMEMAPPSQDGGIAALMAQQGAPTEQAPAQFARGGLVQGFAEGSDEDGVTPMQEAPSSYGISATPEMVERARTQFTNVLAQEPLAIPDLRVEAEKRAALYRDILGDNTQAQQAQMLMNLGQRAFGFAANVDDQGRALRGSFLSRLAGATRTLPGEMAQYIAASDEQQRKARMLGLQAAEKDIEATRTSNMKLLETQRKGYADILKAAEKAKDKGTSGTGPFGNSLPGRSLAIMVNMARGFAEGKLSEEERNIFMAAVQDYTQPTRTETKDPLTGETRTIVNRKELPDFVKTALGQGGGRIPSASPGAGGAQALKTELPADIGGATSAEAPVTVQGKQPGKGLAAAPSTTLFDLSGTGTGLVPVVVSGIAKNIPLDVAGRIAPEYQQGTALVKSIRNRIVNALQESPRFAEGERVQILKELDIDPKILANEASYVNSLVAVDKALEGLEGRAVSVADNKKTGMDARREAFKKVEDIRAVRRMVGVAEKRVDTPEQWRTLPPGKYLVLDPKTGAYVSRSKLN